MVAGKTTLLNIIGGLDRYTTGDLIINGKSTKKFKDRDWDAYRNYKVGFIFQSYNLISHQTVLSNVELALTIGGISKKERKQRAIKALEEVGLKDHINKKPNQLSGGQMQRVAIARALVNNPDIILADEPTGALDTKTSVQVMEILKKISKDKLIIMVTHNPELAEKYSSRIIRILDGTITEDSDPVVENISEEKVDTKKIKRTSMKLWTAFRLSLNNLLTKKGRTILVSFAGSIGIIGIALVQAISNGFQGYVDSIQEDTLTSYPLTVAEESTDLTSMLLSMTSEDEESNDKSEVKEEQYISNILSALTTNDLKSFKKYLEENEDKVNKNVSSVEYKYSVEPNIYTIDATKKMAKLNPSNLFNYGSSTMMASMTSTYSKMISDKDAIRNSYDILAGRLPEKYDEMMIVLSEPNKISDFLVYSLGLRDTDELSDIVTKIMNGEKAEVNNEPLKFSYDDLMNVELKLVLPTDLYKYNEKYDIYEDMSENDKYMQNIYDKALKLKIVGIVSPKEGTTSMMLNPGVNYTSDLIDYIINYSEGTEIVQKQLADKEVDVFSGSRFDEKKDELGLDFKDFLDIDTKALESAFNIKIDKKDLENKTKNYMKEINDALSTDTDPAKKDFSKYLNTLAKGMFNSIKGKIDEEKIDKIVSNYLNGKEATKIFTSLEKKYVIPKKTLKTVYSGLLKSLLQAYVVAYKTMMQSMVPGGNLPSESYGEVTEGAGDTNTNNETTENEVTNGTLEENTDTNTLVPGGDLPGNVEGVIPEVKVVVNDQIVSTVISSFTSNSAIKETENQMAKAMTEAVMKKTVLTKVGELTSNLTSSFASAFNVDQKKIAGAFKVNITEEEITRIITSMMSGEDKTAKTNLISLGYQNLEEPTFMSFYFDSFDGKEEFIKFIDDYNNKMEKEGKEDKVIHYTDATGILMNSVKTIVNAVTYVLIAFISISLIVSSIMIGIITYISVYERTKEIGILRAMGASKRNISSIFNAETFIIGFLSGAFGIGISYALIPIINKVLHSFTGNIPLTVTLYVGNAVFLVILSVVLTLIGGLIPARAASKKDPVIALRTE